MEIKITCRMEINSKYLKMMREISDKINLFDLIHQLNPYVFEIKIMLMHLRTKGTDKSCFIKFMWGFDHEEQIKVVSFTVQYF
jgi:hypothetical protein